jgi:serine/threonine protein kinase
MVTRRTLKAIPDNVVKQVKVNPFVVDLEARQIFDLEVESLQRLDSCNNVPQLIQANDEDLTIEMSYCGYAINRLKKQTNKRSLPGYAMPKKHIKRIDQQIQDLSDTLQDRNITYLDLNPRNICLTYEHNINLVDFGMVVLDDKPQGRVLTERYERYLDNGGRDYFCEVFRNMVFDVIVPHSKIAHQHDEQRD